MRPHWCDRWRKEEIEVEDQERDQCEMCINRDR